LTKVLKAEKHGQMPTTTGIMKLLFLSVFNLSLRWWNW